MGHNRLLAVIRTRTSRWPIAVVGRVPVVRCVSPPPQAGLGDLPRVSRRYCILSHSSYILVGRRAIWSFQERTGCGGSSYSALYCSSVFLDRGHMHDHIIELREL